MSDKKKFYVIDGNSLLFRAYYATAGWGDNASIMQTKDGIPTNAVFAFSNMITKILQGFKGGEYLFIGFDADSRTFRKEEFEAYKANRKPCPPELVKQFPISREYLDAMNILHYEEHGIEADDICGSLAKQAGALGFDVQVYTSDKDYLQLIDDNVTVNLLKTGMSSIEVMTPSAMVEKYGFTPKQIIDFKGLRGDSSDNLPGIPGVGDKTAVKLIQEYGSLEAIIEAAETMKSKVGENIRNNKELGRTCYKLATILTGVELPFSIEDCLYRGYDFEKVSSFASRYEMRQFVSRLPLSLKKTDASRKKIEFVEVPSFKGIDIGKKIGLAIDVDELSYNEARPDGLAIYSREKAYYIRLSDLLSDESAKIILEDESILKDTYDWKLARVALSKLGITLRGHGLDLLLSSYLIDSSLPHSAEAVYSSLGADISADDQGLGLLASSMSGKTSKMAGYAYLLKEKVLDSMKTNQVDRLYEEIESPLSEILSEMEIEGFPIDKSILSSLGDTYRAKAEEIASEIYQIAGGKFNISSPKQVGEVLFAKLGLPDIKRGSTSVEVMKELSSKHPIVPKILEYRKYSKLVSTYVEGLLPHVQVDGKIHTCFNQAQTTTGRLSSSNPNLQNIATRDEEGKAIKKAFYYQEEEVNLASLDYGQIELRVLASMSGCQKYIDVFNSGRDVHTETAKMIFSTEEPTSLERRRAKAVNFAIIYGTTSYGLAEQIGCPVYEANDIIASFYNVYPEIGEYLRSIISNVETKGYVSTMFGRKRYLRDISDSNYAKREAAKRAALNAPVQGSAADLIKIAMIKVHKFLRDGGYKTKMVLQIHDELIFRIPDEETWLLEDIRKIMEEAVELKVKLIAEGAIGKTWYDCKE